MVRTTSTTGYVMICTDYNQLSKEQIHYLLSNYNTSVRTKSILTSNEKMNKCYLFFMKTYNELWWDDCPKDKIVTFDEFITDLNEYKLMDML